MKLRGNDQLATVGGTGNMVTMLSAEVDRLRRLKAELQSQRSRSSRGSGSHHGVGRPVSDLSHETTDAMQRHFSAQLGDANPEVLVIEARNNHGSHQIGTHQEISCEKL